MRKHPALPPPGLTCLRKQRTNSKPAPRQPWHKCSQRKNRKKWRLLKRHRYDLFLHIKEVDNLFARITISLVLQVLMFSAGQDASASLPQKPQKRVLLLYGMDGQDASSP